MRPPGCDKTRIPLSEEAGDAKMMMIMGHHVTKHGTGSSNWSTCVPKKSGVRKCGKSCNLRWTNHLRPELKQESFTADEEELIIKLHSAIGSRWSIIAQQLPGRTDNEVKNYWNSSLKKKLKEKGIDPITHRPFSHILRDYENIGGTSSSSSHPIINNRTIFVPNYNQHQQPPHQLGLLAQLQSIKLVTETSSIGSFPSPPPPSSSSYSSSSATSSSSSSELQSFGWSEFLLEDGGGSSDHDMKEEVELVIKGINDDDDVAKDDENKMMMNVGVENENENEMKDHQFEGSEMGVGGEEGSFVEAMLKRDREMYFMEFPQLWEE